MKKITPNLRQFCLKGSVAFALAMLALAIGCRTGQTAQPASIATAQTSVTAIDIALEPDAKMIQHAEAVNARLRSVFPKGFALDASHHPHITMLQRYVRTADLDKVYAAADKVFISYNVTSFKLKAYKYYYLTSPSLPGLGLSGIVVETTPELVKLQHDLIDAVAPYTVATGTSAAYVSP